MNDLYDRPSIHNELTELILQRIKYIVGFKGYTDVSKASKSIVARLDKYGLGKKRPLKQFLEISGIDFEKKRVNRPHWCPAGETPKYVASAS